MYHSTIFLFGMFASFHFSLRGISDFYMRMHYKSDHSMFYVYTQEIKKQKQISLITDLLCMSAAVRAPSVVRPEGVEPTTSWLGFKNSIQLSYGRIFIATFILPQNPVKIKTEYLKPRPWCPIGHRKHTPPQPSHARTLRSGFESRWTSYTLKRCRVDRRWIKKTLRLKINRRPILSDRSGKTNLEYFKLTRDVRLKFYNGTEITINSGTIFHVQSGYICPLTGEDMTVVSIDKTTPFAIPSSFGETGGEQPEMN